MACVTDATLASRLQGPMLGRLGGTAPAAAASVCWRECIGLLKSTFVVRIPVDGERVMVRFSLEGAMIKNYRRNADLPAARRRKECIRALPTR
jgi:hypothetical protein